MAKLLARNKWLARLTDALRDGSFAKLSLGGPTARCDTLKNVFVRPVELKDGPRLSFVYRYAARDVTKNHPRDEALALIETLIGEQFRHAHLFTTREILELRFRDDGHARIIASKPEKLAPSTPAHDRPKQRLIGPNGRWLHTLGVTTADGNVAKGMEAKFRQINKFVEVLGHLLQDAGIGNGAKDKLTVVDMGCGKGYLTFAAYEWLRRTGWNEATVRGIEARPDLVDLCNHAAQENHFDLLQFETGTIAAVAPVCADVLVALHACDTATDDAIAWGVRAGASLIIVSPCCHKELRPQLRSPPALAGALRHGILLERQAEFVTDALRAALLEWAGYETKVFEFVSTEHTAKNLMIAATKRSGPTVRTDDARKVRELAAAYGVRRQRLATHLGLDLSNGAASR